VPDQRMSVSQLDRSWIPHCYRDRASRRKVIRSLGVSAILASWLSIGFFESVASAQVVVPSQADITRLRPSTIPLPAMPQFDLRLETPEKSPIPRAVDIYDFSCVISLSKAYRSMIQNFLNNALLHLSVQRSDSKTFALPPPHLRKPIGNEDFF